MGIMNKFLTGTALLVVVLGIWLAIPTGFTSIAVSTVIAGVVLAVVAMNLLKAKI